jgi:hypothetical protein
LLAIIGFSDPPKALESLTYEQLVATYALAVVVGLDGARPGGELKYLDPGNYRFDTGTFIRGKVCSARQYYMMRSV